MERQRITDEGQLLEQVDAFVPQRMRSGMQTRQSMEPSGVSPARSNVLKVSTRSRPSAVAGAIAGVVREEGRAEMQAIGAGATNQAIKAIAIARSYLQEEEIDLCCIPSFIDVVIDAEERTALHLLIESRRL